VRVFSVFHKTDQNRPNNIQNAQNEQNTLCAIQRNTVLCVFLSLKKCLQKTFAKHVQNIAKHPQNTAKHRKTLFFKTHPQNTTNHPQTTRKTPQNTAKHHKTDLLTKQTKLANKPLRSRSSRGVNPTHTEPQPDTAGGKHHKGGNSTRGNPRPANKSGPDGDPRLSRPRLPRPPSFGLRFHKPADLFRVRSPPPLASRGLRIFSGPSPPHP